MSDDIYHEISEDLRQKELAAFWQENRYWIIGGAIAAVIFTGALSWWREYEYQKNMSATGQFLAAADTSDPAKIEAYAAAADKKHTLLAKFAEARLYVERHDPEKAAAVYDSIAAMRGTDDTWRDLAKLYAVGQRLDSGDPAKLHAALEDLSGKKNPWRYSAREMTALLLAREGKMKEAADVLSALADEPLAPQGLRARAGTLRALYAGGKAGG